MENKLASGSQGARRGRALPSLHINSWSSETKIQNGLSRAGDLNRSAEKKSNHGRYVEHRGQRPRRSGRRHRYSNHHLIHSEQQASIIYSLSLSVPSLFIQLLIDAVALRVAMQLNTR